MRKRKMSGKAKKRRVSRATRRKISLGVKRAARRRK